ncbi:DUF423 domain-containing protein [Flavobacterium salilacus subsp. salilacus]|uniref:DUF423 domain-containing protein n=1 Tax=Flavobacterium TaxID=237 RepID=UPI001074CF6B|nr:MULTISPECIES: DUF423 domain-containing protein [Flavobacterium]KAF2520112.1 DUF423 domain-containing protein [Flavobacterium salilacus subsp. salilacus]MBE1613972.1 DUF423 domain-containing protein [Flavobacterium sp. SaA2.13]NDI97918.1 DUF423 domain-containing protein [Flavobacterium salilacus subsp. altitudinum]
MNRKILVAAAVLGIIAIALGAFGAHGLKKLIEPEMLITFETGVRYQMYHALFLLFVGTTPLVSEKTKKIVFILTLTGVLFFSVSIYFLACNTLFSFDFRKIGIITPVGGLLLIAAWGVLLLNLIKRKG